MKHVWRGLKFATVAYALAFAWVWVIAASHPASSPQAASIAFRELSGGALLWFGMAVVILLWLSHVMEENGFVSFWYDALICVIAATVSFNMYFTIHVIRNGFDDDGNIALQIFRLFISSAMMGIGTGAVIGVIYAAINRRR